MWIVMDKYLLVICVIGPAIIQALRDVKVTMPKAVQRGENALLVCRYDMEGDNLYSVKWYKGKREFYRYTPKEIPAMQIFRVPGIDVVREMSNESQVTLHAASKMVSGKYHCEVSADAPSFHTLISNGELEVVEVPEHRPVITGIKSRYRLGEILRGNCTSKHSRPPANLTWAINSMHLASNDSHLKHYKALQEHRNNELMTSMLGIQIVVTKRHFATGKLKIKCTARIHRVYLQSTEKSIEEERPPRIVPDPSINNVNNKLYQSYDQFTVQDPELVNKKDTYLPIQGEMSSHVSLISHHHHLFVKVLPLFVATTFLASKTISQYSAS